FLLCRPQEIDISELRSKRSMLQDKERAKRGLLPVGRARWPTASLHNPDKTLKIGRVRIRPRAVAERSIGPSHVLELSADLIGSALDLLALHVSCPCADRQEYKE